MPEIHLPTFLVLLLLIYLVQGVMLLLFARSTDEYGGVKLWAAGSLCVAMGCAAVLVRPFVPLLASVVATNLFMLLAPALFLDGLRRFLGRPAGHAAWWGYALVLLTVAVQVVFTFADNLPARLFFMSMTIAVLLLRAAWLLARYTALQDRSAARFTALGLVLMGAAALVRGLGVLLVPISGIFVATGPQQVGSLGSLLGMMLATTGFAFMVAQRLVADLRASQRIAQRQVSVLEDLGATMADISAERDLAPLLASIVSRAARLLCADVAELLLLDEDRGDLVLAARHPAVPHQAARRQAVGEGAIGHVALTRRSLILNDYRAWPGALPDEVACGLRASLDVPLLRADQLVGVLGISTSAPDRAFSADDEHVLKLFARQATVAILNARLYEQLNLDPLTRLNSRGRFFELAEPLLAAVSQGRRPLAVALLDVDRFKAINDTHGHAVGDDVLRWVSGHIARWLPPGAVCGRIGGEEFAVLLPDSPFGAARAALDALRRQVTAAPALTAGLALPVTVSIGVTERDMGDATLDELLLRADRALYRAKSEGRNRLCWQVVESGAHAECSCGAPP